MNHSFTDSDAIRIMNLQRPLNHFQHLALAILKKTIGIIWVSFCVWCIFFFKALYTGNCSLQLY